MTYNVFSGTFYPTQSTYSDLTRELRTRDDCEALLVRTTILSLTRDHSVYIRIIFVYITLQSRARRTCVRGLSEY